jgi:hypothetical protein
VLRETKKLGNFTLALKRERLEIVRSGHCKKGVAVVAGDSQSGQAILGHQGDVLGGRKGESVVDDLLLQSGVVLFTFTHLSLHVD